jgi:hypothetical protein
VWNNEVELSHFAPDARLETRLAGGMVRRPDIASASKYEWTARGDFGVRAGGSVTVRGRLERAPYLDTVANLDTPVTTHTAAALVQWTQARGWLAEAAVQRQNFRDGNNVDSRYAWLLAPVARGAHGQLQAGYAVSAADSEEDRFVLARPQQPFPPADPRFDFSGVYQPYYTPARILTHSLITAVTVSNSKGRAFRAGGSYGFRAHENATAFSAAGDRITASTGRRSYHPWTVRGSFETPVSPALTFSGRAESGRTAFYRWTTASIHLLYRFLPRDPGRLSSQ